MTAFNIKNLYTIYYEINCNPIVETKRESNQIVILMGIAILLGQLSLFS